LDILKTPFNPVANPINIVLNLMNRPLADENTGLIVVSILL
jgi:hypothetical protein